QGRRVGEWRKVTAAHSGIVRFASFVNALQLRCWSHFYGKPVSTFPENALASSGRGRAVRLRYSLFAIRYSPFAPRPHLRRHALVLRRAPNIGAALARRPPPPTPTVDD